MRTPLFALIFAASSAFAQQPAALPPLVTTTGSAQIRVVPDLADLSFEVEVRSADLAIARKQEGERAAKILTAIRAAGVAESELQTSQVQISPDFTNDREETEKLKFYRVSQVITCTLHDVKKVPDLTAAAVAAGATGVQNATLRSSELRKHRDEARAMAAVAAKEKAIALATKLGATVGRPYSISEQQDYDRYNRGQNISMNNAVDAKPAGDGTIPTFAPGMISITASVSVSFLLE